MRVLLVRAERLERSTYGLKIRFAPFRDIGQDNRIRRNSLCRKAFSSTITSGTFPIYPGLFGPARSLRAHEIQ